ncbi:MAG TPA: hypothetical protein PK796_12480 [Bacteroidales bacterium]|nr:hypothetical protein [Bacteroidales bacterium]
MKTGLTLKLKSHRICGVIMVTLSMLLFTSCTIEHRLAKEYIRSGGGESLLVVPSDFLYKTNNTYQEPDPVNMISERAMDSVGYYKSTYLQYISDSVFLEKFYNAFITEMEESGYDIYLPADSQTFDRESNRKWIIRFAQLQLEEESRKLYEDTYDPEENYYYKEYDVSSVGINSWTEVSFSGSPDQQRLLYLSGFIEDEFEGGFNYNHFDDKMYFSDKTLRITYNDIYRMAVDSGKKHAELLIDYLLNDYIRRNMPPGTTRLSIFHYDKRFRTLTNDVTERFEVLR